MNRVPNKARSLPTILLRLALVAQGHHPISSKNQGRITRRSNRGYHHPPHGLRRVSRVVRGGGAEDEKPWNGNTISSLNSWKHTHLDWYHGSVVRGPLLNPAFGYLSRHVKDALIILWKWVLRPCRCRSSGDRKWCVDDQLIYPILGLGSPRAYTPDLPVMQSRSYPIFSCRSKYSLITFINRNPGSWHSLQGIKAPPISTFPSPFLLHVLPWKASEEQPLGQYSAICKAPYNTCKGARYSRLHLSSPSP